jgi:glycerophosphoryl diester phosphodiesterase
MEAFAGAVGLGYRWLETDLHLTADGAVVCFHDDTVDRTTGSTGPVAALTLAELTALDAGFRFAPERDHPRRGRGVRVPTLEEVVTSFADTRVIVDLKQDGLEQPLAGLIARLRLWDRVVVGSFSDRRLRRFRALTGDRVATSTGPVETIRRWAMANAGRVPAAADAIQVPERAGRLSVITPRTLAGFRRAGSQVHVWTVNEPADMRRLLDWGVDGLITDRPDLLKEVLVERGEWRSGG